MNMEYYILESLGKATYEFITYAFWKTFQKSFKVLKLKVFENSRKHTFDANNLVPISKNSIVRTTKFSQINVKVINVIYLECIL